MVAATTALPFRHPVTRSAIALAIVLVLRAVAAAQPPEPEPTPEPKPPEFVVRAPSRLVWEQPPSADGTPALDLSFTLYVEGMPQPLLDVSCAAIPESAAARCDAPLPALGGGVYTLRISALARAPILEGPQSTAIVARVEPVTMLDGQALGRVPGPAASSAALDDPTDLAFLPDGRVLVGERGGRVRLVEAGLVVPEPLLVLSDVQTGDGRGLLAIAVAPDFAGTRAVFVLYSAGSGLRVSRFTMAAGALTAPAVVLEGLPAARRGPAARMRVGRDGKLYLALDDGGDAARAADAGSWSGKVLRLELDGTTPRDRPGPSPVVLAGLHRPLGLIWRDASAVWVADSGSGALPRLYQFRTDTENGTASVQSQGLPADTISVAVTSSPSGDAPPALITVAGRHTPRLWRVGVGGDSPVTPQPVAEAGDDPIRLVGVAEDGSVFVCTSRGVHRLPH